MSGFSTNVMTLAPYFMQEYFKQYRKILNPLSNVPFLEMWESGHLKNENVCHARVASLELRILTFGKFEIMKVWKFAILKLRNFEYPELWSFGTLDLRIFRAFGILELWNFRNFENVNIWNFEALELWNFETSELLIFQTFDFFLSFENDPAIVPT